MDFNVNACFALHYILQTSHIDGYLFQNVLSKTKGLVIQWIHMLVLHDLFCN